MSANAPLRDWSGQRVWIVGASSGIGAALAGVLLQRGALVAVSGRRGDVLQQQFGHQPHALILPFDACTDDGWATACAELQKEWPAFDLVIQCQGDYSPLQIDQYSGQTALKMLDVNLLSLYRSLDHLLPWLQRTGRGGLAIMASVAGWGMLPKAMAYGAGKSAAIYLAHCLHYELAPRGHGVWCINPGFVATRLTAQNDFDMPALLTPEQAAGEIVAGFARGDFEIHFPKRFTRWLKLIALLPRPLQHALIRRITGV